MIDEAALGASWEAVQRSVRDGDVSANLMLHQQLRSSLGEGETWTPKPVLHTLGPCLLRYCLESYKNGSPVDSAALLFVSIINRIVCLKLLPEALARPLDRRPTGIQELACFYQDILSSFGESSPLYLPSLTRRQLIVCLGCLLVLMEDNVADTLRAQFTAAASVTAVSTVSRDLEDVFQVFIAVVEILSDDRVPIGPIRRATQRKRVQTQLDMLLAAPAISENLLRLQAEAVTKGIEFLMSGTIGEPQEIAAAFWQQLPTSTVWQWALEHQKRLDETSTVVSQQLLCVALRSLSVVDAAAEQLLFSGVTSVTNGNAIDVVASCKVIAAALESITENVVLHYEPSSSLFGLISGAAEHLIAVLGAPDIPEEAVRVVCEGISVLTQSLTPVPIPVAEPTDDPEDFMELVESIKLENEKKMATAQVLCEYLCRCQRELGFRLASMTSSHTPHQRDEAEENRVAIASYVLEQAKGEKESLDDFQVYFEDTSVAVFTAYERLIRLLGNVPPEVTAVSRANPALAVVAACASESIRVIYEAEPRALLEQATLLPVLSARYINNPRMCAWNQEDVKFFLQCLVNLLELASKAGLSEREFTIPTIADTLVDVVLRWVSTASVSSFREECTHITKMLWGCLMDGGCALPQCLRVAHSIAQLMDHNLAHAAFSDTVAVACKLDPRAQLEILSACLLDSSNSFEYLLRLVECISPNQEEQLLDRAGSRMVQSATSLLTANGQLLEGYQNLIWVWYLRNSHHLRFIFQISKPLPPSIRCALRAEALRFHLDRSGGPDNVCTEDLCSVLSEEVCGELAVSPDSAVTQSMISVLGCLLQPSPSFSITNGMRRLRVLVCCALALRERHAPESRDLASVEQSFVHLFCLAVARFKEARAVHLVAEFSNGSGLATNLNEGPEGELQRKEEDGVVEATLEDIAALGKCVNAATVAPLMSSCPSWLVSLSQAVDNYDRRDRINRLVI